MSVGLSQWEQDQWRDHCSLGYIFQFPPGLVSSNHMSLLHCVLPAGCREVCVQVESVMVGHREQGRVTPCLPQNNPTQAQLRASG